jgi:hypothetical protein
MCGLVGGQISDCETRSEWGCTVVNLFDLTFWCALVLYTDDAATLHGVGCHGGRKDYP